MRLNGEKLTITEKIKMVIYIGGAIFKTADDIESIEIKGTNGTGIIFEEDCSYSETQYL